MKIPKTPQGIARSLTALALQRLALEDQIKAIKAKESRLQEAGVLVFKDRDAASVHVEGRGKVTLTTQPTIDVTDWPAVFAYAAKNPDSGLVHRRASPTALEKLLLDGAKVPGCRIDHRRVLSINVREGRKAQ